MDSKESIAHQVKLLQIEKEEDLKLYKSLVLDRSLKERIQKGITWYPLHLKHIMLGLGERYSLEIDLAEDKAKPSGHFQSGSVVSVFGTVADEEVGRLTGVISLLGKKRLKIALSSESIPDWLHAAKLGMDLEFDDKTYQQMRAALENLQKPGDNQRLRELRETLLGNRKPEFHKWEVTFKHPQLNASQNRAVQKVLEAKDVAIIHGPPGTGKTTTLIYALEEILRHEHQVLVCAPSNTAVDLLTLKCIELGMDVVRLGNPARVDEALQKHTLDGAISEHPDYPALRKMRKEAEAVRKTALKFKRNFGSEQRRRRQELLQEARELKQHAKKLEGYILHHVINRTPVITATLSGAASNQLQKKRFHTVLIDEAGQALAPATWIPIQRAGRVIMAGDHLQLPPTVKSFEAEKKGLGISLFQQVIETKEVDVMLDQQYRMNEQIMEFSARQFYKGKLKADPSVKHHALGPHFPVVSFIDTAGCGFDEKVNSNSRSTFNPEEAQLLLKHLALTFNQLHAEVPETFEKAFSIGIISPYKAQVQTLKNQLQSSPMLSSFQQYINVNTVDGFQGQERDIIYISLVRSNAKGEIGFLKDIRRMNVALTRARKRLVVIGDSATLGKHPFYQAFLDYVEQINAYQSAWEWVE
ncbi:MAG: AAA domain-containing protein [Bacteroidota bacterium]